MVYLVSKYLVQYTLGNINLVLDTHKMRKKKQVTYK